MIQSGIDFFKSHSDSILKNRNISLLTGSSNVDSMGIPAYQTIKKIAGKRLKSIWSLQHGFFINAQDNMILSDSLFWDDLNLRVNSLYGKTLLPEEKWLEDIDAVIIDVFDTGTRVYTFLNHIVQIMKFLSGKHIEMIILDRVNPLNGIEMEGNVTEEDCFSIVGMIPVPMRHSLTAGEYLNFARKFHKIDINLEVIKLSNWNRKDFFNGLWTYPSPNMPSFKTAMVYPGAVLLEGTNLSEGRGTTRPFEFVGSPFIDNARLIKELDQMENTSARFVPVFFKPEYSKFANKTCRGVLIHPEDIKNFRSFQTYYEIIRVIKLNYPDMFEWKQPPYEFEYQKLPIDVICGSEWIRKSIEKNLPFSEIQPAINQQIQNFKEKISPFLLY